MKKIVFEGNGDMQRMYPDGIEVEGESAWECMSALSNFPGFRKSDGKFYHASMPDFGSRDALKDKTDKSVIRVVELIGGSGGKLGSAILIVIGVVLISTGFGAPQGVAILGTTISSATLISTGAMLILNGIQGLLMQAPEISKQGNDERSAYLPANKNTVRIGTRIPLAYGRCKLYGHFLSFNVSATNMEIPAAPSVVPTGGSTVVGGAADPTLPGYNGGKHWEYEYIEPDLSGGA